MLLSNNVEYKGGKLMKKKLLISLGLTGIIASSISLGVYAATDIKLWINGNLIDTDMQIVNGSSYVPLRVVSDSLGADVQWDENERTISITSKVEVTPTPTPTPTPNVPIFPKDAYEIEHLVFFNLTANKVANTWEITVDVVNNGKIDIKAVTFSAVFYDNNGKRIGRAQGGITDLRVSETKTVSFVTSNDLTGYSVIRYQIDSSS
jgi:hypothetical protein